MMADQLVADYAAVYREGVDDSQGFLDAVSTIRSWQETAADHGEELTEDDWVQLVSELARRAALADDVDGQ
ncbi:MAG TPA: hypothetical protein VE224_19500 [Pseudolabrys sp.]|nr:hypothetical protein [Pseudolabrys sp.]